MPNEQLDPQAKALAMAIRHHETGNRQIAGASGEIASRYQFLPSTWKSGAAKYLGDANAPVTLENENKVAYSQIKEWKDSGMNPGQIAAAWNAGPGSIAGDKWKTMKGTNAQGVNYDVPKYVASVYSNYQKLKPAEQQKSAQPQEGLLSSIGKSILETPAKLGTAIYNVASSAGPAATAVGLDILGEKERSKQQQILAEQELNKARDLPFLGKTEPMFAKNVAAGNDLGVLKEAIGGAAELASYGIGGGAAKNIVGGGLKGALGRVALGTGEAALGGAMQAGGQAAVQGKSAGEIASAAGKGALYGGATGGVLGAAPILAKGAAKLAAPTAKFAIGKSIGVGTEHIGTILNPETAADFAAARASNLGREELATKVTSKFEGLKNEVAGLGKAYEPIRASTAQVDIPSGYWNEKLSSLGVKLKDGVVDRSTSKVMTQADANAINDFLQTYAKEGPVVAEDFLRSREGLANIAKYDMAKSTVSTDIGSSLREAFNNDFRANVPGLAEADAAFAPVRQFFGELSKDLTTGGKYKPNLFSKIANAGNKSNQVLLEKLERLSPGITKDIKILAALENIELASSGQKVGAYGQGILLGGVGALTGGPVGAVIGAILSSPKIIVPILEKIAAARGLATGFAEKLGNKIIKGVKPSSFESNIIKEAIDAEVALPTFTTKALPRLPPETNPALILPEFASPQKIELPGPGILEGQRNIIPPKFTPGESGIVKGAQNFVIPKEPLSLTKQIQNIEDKFRKEAGLMAPTEGAGVRQRNVTDAVGGVNFVANEFKLNRAKSDMFKRAGMAKDYAKQTLYENDPTYKALVDKRDAAIESQIDVADPAEKDLLSKFDEYLKNEEEQLKQYAKEQGTLSENPGITSEN